MSMQIPANDHGTIYVFEVTDAPSELSEKTDAALMAAFGPVVLNTDYVDVVETHMLADMTLPQLITNGYDMPVADDVAEVLRAIKGTTVLIMSAAFGGQEVSIDLPKTTRLVTTLREKAAIKITEPLTAKGAEGILQPKPGKPPKSNARMSGMVATYALLAMFALVGLMIWIGG